MKTTTEHKRRVGIFVTVGIVVLCVSIFFIGGNKLFKSQYDLKAQFPQIQGLSDGSVVSLSGIKIGNIEKVEFLPKMNMIEVTMRVEKIFSDKITQGSKVEIRTQGALGDKFLFIEPGPTDATPLTENSVIPTAPNNDLLSVLSDKGDKATVFFEILEDIHKLTQILLAQNRLGDIPLQAQHTLKQMTLTFSEVTKLLQDIRGEKDPQAPSKLAKIVDRMDAILAKVEKGEGSLGAIINDSSIHDQLKAILGGQNSIQQTRSILRTSIKHQENESQ